MVEYLSVFLIAFAVAVFSVVAGGGGGLILSPLLILIGMPPSIMVATTKFAGLGMALGSVRKFHKHGQIQWSVVKPLMFVGLGAAFLGPFLLVRLNEDMVSNVVGLIVIAMAPFVLWRDFGKITKTASRAKRYVGTSLFGLINFLQGAFSGGIGTLLPFVFMGYFGLNALQASATKRLIGLPIIFAAFVSLMINGIYPRWDYAAIILIGSGTGGWLGAHLAIKKGVEFVRIVLVISTFLLGLALLILH